MESFVQFLFCVGMFFGVLPVVLLVAHCVLQVLWFAWWLGIAIVVFPIAWLLGYRT